MLTILADAHIPYVKELFSPLGKLILLESADISPDAVRNADALLIRSVTSANESLLDHATVKFIGTPTAGTNHLDISFLKQRAITWAYAPGANAPAVCQYVLCSVAYLHQQHLLKKHGRAMIMGSGHIGQLVANQLRVVGYEVLEYDPPRAARDPLFTSASLDELDSLDLVSAHLPLTKQVPHSTHHFFDSSRLSKLKSRCVFLNTSRGDIVDESALLDRTDILACLDVWAHEPMVNTELVQRALLATPHIAGYTVQAKLRATIEIYRQLVDFFNLSLDNPPSPTPVQVLEVSPEQSWEEIILSIYNPHTDSLHTKEVLCHSQHVAQIFLNLRQTYPLRKEFSAIRIKSQSTHQTTVLQQLGFAT